MRPRAEPCTRRALDAEARTRAGCVKLSRCRRGKGTLVGVYRSVEAGIDADPACPWSVVCEDHGTLVGVRTRREAEESATDTRLFCDGCRDLDDGGEVS